MTELLPSKSDICSNAEDSSTDMLLVGFESYMVNEQGLSQGTIRGRMFMIHRYLKACAENAIIDVFSSYAAEEFLKFLRLKKRYSRRSLQYVTYCLRIPLYSITDWHRSPISDSHTFDQPGT